MRCTLATGAGFGSEVTSGRIEWGAEEGSAWVDFEGDGDRDFCRPIGASVTTAQLFCTLWPGLAHTVTSSPVDLGYGTDRAWVDHNGDGRADYCRRVGDAPNNTRISCTISNGTGFGPLPSADQPAPTPTPTPSPAPPGGRPDVPLKRIVIFLRWDKSSSRTSTRFKYLRVTDVPRGATVTARCPKGCSRKSYTKRNARGTVSLKRLIAQAPEGRHDDHGDRQPARRDRRGQDPQGPAAQGPVDQDPLPRSRGEAPVDLLRTDTRNPSEDVPVHLEVYWIDQRARRASTPAGVLGRPPHPVPCRRVDPHSRRIGQRVRAEREKAELSHAALAALTGLTKSYLVRLESTGGNPTIEAIGAIADALDLTLADLVQTPRFTVMFEEADVGPSLQGLRRRRTL